MYLCSHAIFKNKKTMFEHDLSLSEFLYLHKKSNICFDDGYRDIYLIKDNILNSKFKIFIFICTDFIEKQNTVWWLELNKYIFNESNKFINFSLNNKIYCYELKNKIQKVQLYFKISTLFKRLDTISQEELLTQILGTDKRSNFSNLFLTWDMLKELSKIDNIVIGSHTMSHPNLMLECKRQIYNELYYSKKIIESHLNKECLHFAIPYGGTDSFNKSIIKEIYSLGYKYIYSTNPLLIDRNSLNLIGRINTKAYNNNFFILKSKYIIKSILNSFI